MLALFLWLAITLWMSVHAVIYSILHLRQLRPGAPRRWQGVLAVVFIVAAVALLARAFCIAWL